MNEILKIKTNEEYKGMTFEIELDYYYDEKSNDHYVDVELGNENLRKIRNKYREINNLLLDSEIKEIRTTYDLSQRDYAILLGFGEITITRYESKTVQDKAQDQIIRESKDPTKFLKYIINNKEKYIKINGQEKYNELITKITKMATSIENKINLRSAQDRGNIEFNSNKLKAVIKYIVQHRKGLTKTILAKLLWYCDFLNYKKYNVSMTGLVYTHLQYGAYPIYYDNILSDPAIEIKCVYNDDYECYFINSCISDYSLTTKEQKVIDEVLDKFKSFKTQMLVEYMHKEKAYIDTLYNQTIPYDMAKYLSI